MFHHILLEIELVRELAAPVYATIEALAVLDGGTTGGLASTLR